MGLFPEFYWGEYFRAMVSWNEADDDDFKRAVNVAVALAHEPAAAKLTGYTVLPYHSWSSRRGYDGRGPS